MVPGWPQTWDLTALYDGVDDSRLVEDIARAADHGADWQSARRRALGYLYLMSAAGGGDDAASADIARRMAPLQTGGRTANGIDRFVSGWRQDRAQGLPHPLARAAQASGVDWRALVSARCALQAMAAQLSSAAPNRQRHKMSWSDGVDLVITSAVSAADRAMMVDMVRGRRVDAVSRPGKLSRPFCLAPDPAIGPFISMRAQGDFGDALVLAHEIQHALDEIALGAPPQPLAAEISARQGERRLLSTVSATFGPERAAALLLQRQTSELVEPLRTLIAQVEAAEGLVATPDAISPSAQAAAFAIPPLYPVFHIRSFLEAFTDAPLPAETATLYRRLATLVGGFTSGRA